MRPEMNRCLLETQYRGFFCIAEKDGLHLPVPDPNELKDVSDTELEGYIRVIKDVMRTPHST